MNFTGYDSLEKIGEGGMATVWKARQVSLDRWVAIKVLSPSYGVNEEDVDMFLAEARNAAKMNHPGIVRVFDAFYENNLFCFVMEYVAGPTMGEMIRQEGTLSQQECLTVAEQVAVALDYAWTEHGIVHCDIKPDNIMLDADGTIKVTDLGLCRHAGKARAQARISGEEYVFGTPCYIAPEQAMGATNISIKTDMYSLGATLYHACTGKRLFASANDTEAMNMQVHSQDEDPYLRAERLSPPFCDFLEILLAKNPNHRYASWQDVISEVARLRQNRSLRQGHLNLKYAASTLVCSPERDNARSFDDRKAKKIPPEFRKLVSENGERIRTWRYYANPLNVRKIWREEWSNFSKETKVTMGSCFLVLLLLLLISVERLAAKREVDRIVGTAVAKAESILRNNPLDFNGAIDVYEDALKHKKIKPKTRSRAQLVKRIEGIRTLRNDRVDIVMNRLRREAGPLLDAGNYTGAALHVASYTGEMAKESVEDRRALAEHYYNRGEQLKRNKPADEN